MQITSNTQYRCDLTLSLLPGMEQPRRFSGKATQADQQDEAKKRDQQHRTFLAIRNRSRRNLY